MKRFLVTCAAVLMVSAALQADVTVKQTMTMSGGMMTMAGGNVPTPVMTMRIKGMKARSDVEVMGQTISTIMDLTAKQLYILNSADKTAKLIDLAAPPAAPVDAAAAAPKMNARFEPTGQSKAIDGVNCDEYSFGMTISLADTLGARGAQMPPEAAEMMKGMTMTLNGSIWVTKQGPGVAEYIAFQKASADPAIAAAIANSVAGMSNNGMDKVMAAAARSQGMPYLTEVDMTMEGTGQMAEMMKQAGPMHMTQKVTEVSTAPIADDLLKVPADYKVTK